MKTLISTIATIVGLPVLASCSPGDPPPPPPPPPIECDPAIECKDIIETAGFVSGIASFDAFFVAVLKFRGQVSALQSDVTSTLAEMAGALGLDTSGSAADVADRVDAHLRRGFDGKVDGELTIAFQRPRCEVSGVVAVQAAARCDTDVKPGKAYAECSGGCVIEASAKANCGGEVKCRGEFPSAQCEGTCEGACELAPGAKCDGECQGPCELDGSAACDGECAGDTDEAGNCAGTCKLNPGAKCAGECKGSCELGAGASCTGICKGECTYDPGGANCDGELTCEAAADSAVECNGTCKGEILPPRLVAECEASVKAHAAFEATCSPPSLDVDYKVNPDWAAETDADAKLEFEAQLRGFVRAFAKLQAKTARLELVMSAGADLVASLDGATKGAARALAESEEAWTLKVAAVCTVAALPEAKTMLTDAAATAKATADAAFKVTTAVGG
jgi:hypothetical protein